MGKKVKKNHPLETALTKVPTGLLRTNSSNISVFILLPLFVAVDDFAFSFETISSPSASSLLPFCPYPCFIVVILFSCLFLFFEDFIFFLVSHCTKWFGWTQNPIFLIFLLSVSVPTMISYHLNFLRPKQNLSFHSYSCLPFLMIFCSLTNTGFKPWHYLWFIFLP